jgi:hypothetical protein
LEVEIVSLRKEEEKREKTSSSHLKENSQDLKMIGEKFSQQERRLGE